MLAFSLLSTHAGIRLEGDYTSLRALRDVVHDINERSPLIKDREGLFIALAYDLRKAFELERDVIRPPAHCKEIGTRYGVNILWPVLLLQHLVLRSSLAFIDHGPQHQACAYMLEAVIEDALEDDFGGHAGVIREAWKQTASCVEFFDDRYSARCALFSSWNAGDRKGGLADLLASMSPMFDQSQKLSPFHGLVTPAIIATWEGAEWPDPKW